MDDDGSVGPVEEIIIEYQRKVPYKGFSENYLFPNETRYRRHDNSIEGGGVAIASKEDLLLPAGWRWVENDWSLIMGSNVAPIIGSHQQCGTGIYIIPNTYTYICVCINVVCLRMYEACSL